MGRRAAPQAPEVAKEEEGKGEESSKNEQGAPRSSSSSSSMATTTQKPLPLPPLPFSQKLFLSLCTKLRFSAGTNDRVLVMRTLSHEIDDPNLPKHNDYLCRAFRDARLKPSSSRARGGGAGAAPLRSLARAVGISERTYWKQYAKRLDALAPGNYRFMDARVRFFDDVVKRAVSSSSSPSSSSSSSGGVEQVVMLAAGFDSRGTRFLADAGGELPEGAEIPGAVSSSAAAAASTSASSAEKEKEKEKEKGNQQQQQRQKKKQQVKNKNLRIYEVDLPPIVEQKRALLGELLPDAETWPRPHLVAADLSDAASAARALLAAPGYDPRAKTLFTAEGLLPYLPRSKTLELFGELSKISGKGSEFAFDFLDSGACGVEEQEGGAGEGGGGTGKGESTTKTKKKKETAPGRAAFAALAHAVGSSGEPFMDAMPSDEASQQRLARSAAAAGAGLELAEVLAADAVSARFYEGWNEEERKGQPAVSCVNAFAVWRKV